jgi:LemA protein
MSKNKIILLVIAGAVLLVLLWLGGSYNSFIKLGEETTAAWAQVENQYQRRFDLIPNLVETVKGIANQEKQVFLGVTEARAKVGQLAMTKDVLNDPEAFVKFQELQGELSTALSRLLATVENYPSLKSNENFLALQDQLEGTENRVAVERMRFNEAAKTYNIKAKSIPGVWLVSIFGLDKTKALFESAEGAETAPKVDFTK